jgi:hypothetical protein
MIGTQNTRLSSAGETIQLTWAMNNISFAKPTTPLISTAVQQARELGWPIDPPLEGTFEMPKNPPTDWNWTLPVQDEGGLGGNLGSVESII